MAPGERSVADVLQDIIRDVQEIVRSEMRLAKTELREEAAKAKTAAGLLGAAAITALFLILSATATPAAHSEALDAAKVKDSVDECRLPNNSVCVSNDDCESGACYFDFFANGPICEPGPLGATCLDTTDCVAWNCSFTGANQSYCKQDNGTVVEQGICEKGTHYCYFDEDCVDGCSCQPLSTSSAYGSCFCE